MKTILLIPAYHPEEKIVSLLKDIPKDVFHQILVINDGSGPEYDPVFDQLSGIDTIKIINHTQNQGKGAALKTGFAHILENFENCRGVITADADGQHSLKDILALAKAMEKESDSLIMGSRSFDSSVPFRSQFGNRMTRMIMRLFFKIRLTDTQSGLRAIPFSLLPHLIDIRFNRYEFEIEMLMTAKKKGFRFKEIQIDTIYENNNAASSFNPVVDSAKIYFVMFRYVLASLATAAVDYLVFFTSYAVVPQIFLCTYFARLVALFLNFVLLKRFVFRSKENIWIIGIKYLSIVVVSGFVSSLATRYFNQELKLNIVLSKVFGELILYVVIFIVQKEFVFKRRDEEL
ncbi:MAG: bifunctional glycosyltransferase family 2/GtrA family protein [Proteobacteria bacterium]|nr:bifunctional glycosyltransferase family 2/GtrA family protein [Pseudomonadota bacterium]MBU1389667.1 bifunctional glycosyltransferase family 2/GtrA family protein [Pseudomonadota bacterium]MBU1542605.1 bifunctional glycosyltransferase family 2/GtrA family protein [Pseudomonadota bacterium]MBU2430137.1 bifunctional glycosyltransferase family 2/GtrA family protein [Pseudomonadota bacterium]MBU2481582.1 bifunctional glycosyltransferase family 2/GtrA family protein [Pseudomonadota bacterium]